MYGGIATLVKSPVPSRVRHIIGKDLRCMEGLRRKRAVYSPLEHGFCLNWKGPKMYGGIATNSVGMHKSCLLNC